MKTLFDKVMTVFTMMFITVSVYAEDGINFGDSNRDAITFSLESLWDTYGRWAFLILGFGYWAVAAFQSNPKFNGFWTAVIGTGIFFLAKPVIVFMADQAGNYA